MSFRNPFITDFIYQSGMDQTAIKEAFKKYASHMAHEVDERGMGYYAGVIRSLDGSLQDSGAEELVNELCHATKWPFRITFLFEAGPSITFKVEPQEKILD